MSMTVIYSATQSVVRTSQPVKRCVRSHETRGLACEDESYSLLYHVWIVILVKGKVTSKPFDTVWQCFVIVLCLWVKLKNHLSATLDVNNLCLWSALWEEASVPLALCTCLFLFVCPTLLCPTCSMYQCVPTPTYAKFTMTTQMIHLHLA